MGTSEWVADFALALARERRSGDAAVLDLREASLGNRVAVVMAKQRLEKEPSDPAAKAAVELLDLTLRTADWPS
jgi:hypothetical protein